MKTLITEDKARFEQKYQSPEVLPSFHNFVVLSNNNKAVQIGQSERRFFMLQAKRKSPPYRKEEWSHMWALVKDPSFHALFFQHLLAIDTSIIVKGQAPMTAFKTTIQSRQASPPIKFLKELLHEPHLMQRPMKNMSDDNRVALMDEFRSRGRFSLKHRTALPPSFANLLESEQWEQTALKQDLSRGGASEQIPVNHVVQCILDHFVGQSYTRTSAEDIKEDLERIGITFSNVKVPAGTPCQRSFKFPSIEGLRYLLGQANYLTCEDDALPVDED